MKNMFYGYSLVLGLAFVVLGCQNNNKDVQQIISSYDHIGQEHNRLLAELLDNPTSQKSQALMNAEKELEVSLPFSEAATNSTGSGLLDNSKVKEKMDVKALAFSKEIDAVLTNPNASAQEARLKIKDVEERAALELEGEARDQFFSYSSTAKSSLEFWQERLAKEEGIGNAAYVPLWKRIGRMIASDAAGAAAGAALGAAISGGNPVVIAGASIISGAMSSRCSWHSKHFCVVASAGKNN